jgi:hypothetical protein
MGIAYGLGGAETAWLPGMYSTADTVAHRGSHMAAP